MTHYTIHKDARTVDTFEAISDAAAVQWAARYHPGFDEVYNHGTDEVVDRRSVERLTGVHAPAD